MPMIAVVCLVCGVCSLVLSLLLNPLCGRLAHRINLVDNPGERKIHIKPIPYGGGMAIWLSFILTVLSAFAMITLFLDLLPLGLPEFIRTHIAGISDPATMLKLAGMLGGATIVFFLGLYDDCRPLPPKIKLAVQIIAAALAWYCDIRVTIFIESDILSFIMTVLWIVCLCNSFNLLDNMNGLSSGVAILAGGHLMVAAAMSGHIFITAILAVFCGSVLGFWRYNFLPTKQRMFMGDAGSLFIGFMLACICAATTYYSGRGEAHSVITPVLALGVAFFDTACVMLIRFLGKAPLFVGDTNHLSHRLNRMGLSKTNSVLAIYLLAFIFGQCAILVGRLDLEGAVMVLIIAAATAGLMATLMAVSPAIIKKNNRG